MGQGVAPHLGRYLEVCLNLDEHRGPRGVGYSSGLLVFGIMLAMCAGREGQRSQARWFRRNWSWIREVWVEGEGKAPSTQGTPDQSTLSRFERKVPVKRVSELLDEAERGTVKNLKSSSTAKERDNVHLCFDGKARSGCTSAETGRTEVDATIFYPATGQVLASRSLEDKEGELKALNSILEDVGEEFRGATLTADAGLTAILKTDRLDEAGMEGLIQIKGNAGMAFDEVKDLPWDKVTEQSTTDETGHGRHEIRIAKVLPLTFVEDEVEIISDKYPSVECIVQIEAWTKRKSTGHVSHAMRYYLGTGGIAAKSTPSVAATLRAQWGIEVFHWGKDHVLGEDRSLIVSPNASRFTARIRSVVAHIGKVAYGSITKFIEDFSDAPAEVAFS